MRPDREKFFLDDVIYSACAHKPTIIGEAASRIGASVRERNAQIEWRNVVGPRNVDRAMVWEVAMTDAPRLRDRLAAILAAEFPE
jgi:uncharacterized protein with HEPN domain